MKAVFEKVEGGYACRVYGMEDVDWRYKSSIGHFLNALTCKEQIFIEKENCEEHYFAEDVIKAVYILFDYYGAEIEGLSQFENL